MSKQCKRYYVSGTVQGVNFRAMTQAQAHNLEITGWVKNLSDGSVEVFACGEEAQLKQLESWLSQGSDAASVTDVKQREATWQTFADFLIV
ncbi:MAG: acylphosphatase [Gammaproteobacteria bacterium]